MKRLLLPFVLLLMALSSLPVGAQSAPAVVTPPRANPDFLIMPGKGLGKIQLDMTHKQVVALLGNPGKRHRDEPADVLTYQSKKSGNQVVLYLVAGRVTQIHFTSPSYQTAGGVTAQNYAEHPDLFTAWKLRGRFVNLKYTRKGEGLTFYNLNADSAHPEYPPVHWGVIHKGAQPRFEVFYLLGEPGGGWLPWDGQDIYAE